MLTAVHVGIVFEKAENAAAHKEVRMNAVIRHNLLEAFVHPVDTISAIYHS